MSANDWSICPRCKAKAEAAKAKRLKDVELAYGKSSRADYDLARDNARNQEPLKDTLREDWEIGIDEDGEFHVIYKAACSKCDFSYRFEDKRQIL